MKTTAHVESMIQHKIRNGAKVNLGSFNRQLKEMGYSSDERRDIRQRVADGTRSETMNEAKHTPGPWFIHDYGNGTQDITARELDGTPCRPAQVYGDALDEIYGPIAIANARLIAAAPDLLEACKNALAESVGQPSRRISAAGLDDLRAAIAKADAVEEQPAPVVPSELPADFNPLQPD